MSESFAGITVPEGDPGGVEGMASALTGMAGALEAAATQLDALPAGMGSWQGAASIAFAGACMTTTGGIATSAEAFAVAAGVARRYAHDLEHAQREARTSISAARDAQHRIDDAKRRLADARARADAAAGRAALASTEVFATGLLGTPSPSAQADQARAEADQADAEADAARAARDLEEAQHDLERAQARGHRAMDAAKDAATAIAGALGALGGTPPAVSAPAPPPPPKEEHHGLFGSIVHAVTHPGEIVDGAKDFAVDTAKGVGDFAVGLKDVAVMGWKLSPVYGAIDPEGQRQELSQLGQGLSYAVHHPADFGKALIDWKDIVGGHPGRAFGQLLPNIALTVFTAGGGAAAKGAEGAVTVSRLAKGADAVEAASDASRGAEGLDAAAGASRGAEGAEAAAGGGGHGLPPGAASGGDDLPPVTYRGDSRPPHIIFREGFQPRGTSTDLYTYARDNIPSQFVGTSLSPEVGTRFAGPGGFRYMIRAPGGIDVNAALGQASPFAHETEIAFQGGIKVEHIVGAHPVGPDMQLGEFIPNPAYAQPVP